MALEASIKSMIMKMRLTMENLYCTVILQYYYCSNIIIVVNYETTVSHFLNSYGLPEGFVFNCRYLWVLSVLSSVDLFHNFPYNKFKKCS